ncbi:hypothetical protein BDR26DRAFT_49975 [Obelidium mucronatum]|nr:hypothetical protein BDR26DRAFT_49975 [Obelidium mucronatum]
MGFLILPFHNQPDDEWAFSFSLLWGCSGLGVFSLGVSTQCPTCLPLKTHIFVFSLFLFNSLCIESDAQNDENQMMKGLSLSLWLLVCCSVCNIAMLRLFGAFIICAWSNRKIEYVKHYYLVVPMMTFS